MSNTLAYDLPCANSLDRWWRRNRKWKRGKQVEERPEICGLEQIRCAGESFAVTLTHLWDLKLVFAGQLSKTREHSCNWLFQFLFYVNEICGFTGYVRYTKWQWALSFVTKNATMYCHYETMNDSTSLGISNITQFYKIAHEVVRTAIYKFDKSQTKVLVTVQTGLYFELEAEEFLYNCKGNTRLSFQS